MKILLHFLFIFNLLTAQAQDKGSVRGNVGTQNGPIPGATVQITGTSLGTATDMQGNYILKNVPGGLQTLEFRSIGFRSLIKKVNLEAGKTLEINVDLEVNNLGLDEVVVTGTMTPTFVTASPIKVEVVTSQFVNTYIPAAASSVVEGLKLVNGIQEVVACGVCFTNSISINGLPGPYTAVLMDGTPMYGNLASVYGLNGIPNMIIDRFEVIKGPSSTLYGSEAVAGVINIITKDPAGQPLVEVDVMGTSHLESFGNLAVAPKIGESKGFIGLNYAYINDFDDRNGDGFGDMANLDRYSLFTKWNIHRKSGKKFTIAAKYFYEDRRNGVEEFLDSRNYRQLRGSDSIYGESIYTNRAELFGTFEFPAKENFKVDYSLSHHLQNSYYGNAFYEAQQSIGFANFIWDKEISHHSLLAGFTARYQNYDDNTIATAGFVAGIATNEPSQQFIPGIFVQDEWKIIDQFTVLGGARLDYYQAHGPIFSPRLNLKYQTGAWTTLRANFGTGFRIVNLFTEDHAFITGQREVEINEALRPERSYNAALNFNHVFTLGNCQGMIDIDGFYTYFTNKIIPDYGQPHKIIYANSDGHAITKGMGINLSQEFAFPLSFNLGFNVQQVTQTEPDADGNMETRAIEFAPKWSGVFTTNYLWKELQLTIAYTARLTGPMALPRVYDLDPHGAPLPYARPTLSTPFSFHNIQVSKAFSGQWSVYGGIQNPL